MPSVAMNPFFEEVASAYPDVMFLSVDVDEVKVIHLYVYFQLQLNIIHLSDLVPFLIHNSI